MKTERTYKKKLLLCHTDGKILF